ncbi:hypothetical protein MO867_19760 [Microbulbifer sp. OS29]|uniref:Uncharacterized protein n=1 Tax=Microbulbifer okhotskensis TaxID=2926617 RepID=A0A9X2J9E8_9GAMM|nr:hypothetical protein [Microbulbifer okhotskensis]MCO1336571.1 hypothetical protein [Microbulbifer okhotskensis]
MMKHSPKLQKKYSQFSEKKRRLLQGDIIDWLKSDFGIEARFIQADEAHYENPSKYIASYDYLKDILTTMCCHKTEAKTVVRQFLSCLESEKIQGEGLIYVGNDKFGACWLSFEADRVNEVVEAMVSISNLQPGFELLVSAVGSSNILGIFEEEYEFVIGRCQRSINW